MTFEDRRRIVLGAGALVALLFTSCGGGSSSPSTVPSPSPQPTPAPTPTPGPTPTPSASPTAVVIEIVGVAGNMSFSPERITLRAGQQVSWHNGDILAHTATQDAGAFDTGLVRPGATSAPVTVTRAGALNYHCEVHPTMVGALDVTP